MLNAHTIYTLIITCVCALRKVNIALMNLASIILDPSLREKVLNVRNLS